MVTFLFGQNKMRGGRPCSVIQFKYLHYEYKPCIYTNGNIFRALRKSRKTGPDFVWGMFNQRKFAYVLESRK